MNLREHIKYTKNAILSKDVLNNTSLNISLFCMGMGSSISEHTSTKKATVYVIEGKGVFNLEGKDIDMLPGVMIYMDENAAHSLSAEENTSFILTLLK